MDCFTKDSTFSDMFQRPEFKEFVPYIISFFPPTNEKACAMKFSAMSEGGGESMANGLNRLLEVCKTQQKVMYHVYDKNQIQADPTKDRTVLFHFPCSKSKKFVLICAGGGYNIVCSTTEAFPAAARINELGYSAFVLNYRCGKGITQPEPMNDVANALRFIIENKNDFGVEESSYAILGYSAGAHLVSTVGTDNIGYKSLSLPKPGAIILAYPVITMGEKTHMGSREFLFGEKDKDNEELIEKYSTEKHVTKDYPPVFLWQCEKDSLVPIDNSQMMSEALKKAGVPYIYETYDSDVHGWGIAYKEAAEGWVDRSIEFWIKNS